MMIVMKMFVNLVTIKDTKRVGIGLAAPNPNQSSFIEAG